MRLSTVSAMVLVAVFVLTGLAACGKKTAPIPPEDVPPAKQERSSSKLGVQYTFFIDR
jgi:predicted small lipoprotein YifL